MTYVWPASGRRVCRTGHVRLLNLGADTGRGQSIHQRRVARLVEELPHRSRHDRSDVRDGIRAPRPAPAGSRRGSRKPRARALRAAFAHVTDSDAMQQPPDLRALGSCRSPRPDWPRTSCPCDRAPRRPSTVRPIQVGVVADQSRSSPAVDERLTKAFDVHRPARREVQQPPADPRRARRVLAAPHDFLLRLDQRRCRRTGRSGASPTARGRRAARRAPDQ